MVVLAGLAGLTGGAYSTAAGECTSVASHAELARAEVAVEGREILTRPREEEDELTTRFVDRGVERGLAREVARQLARDSEQAFDIHAREELGVEPGELTSPWLAAGSSFAAFSAGAPVPVLPYAVGAELFGAGAIAVSAAASLGAVRLRGGDVPADRPPVVVRRHAPGAAAAAPRRSRSVSAAWSVTGSSRSAEPVRRGD